MADFLQLFRQFYNSQLPPCHQFVSVKNGDRWCNDKRQTLKRNQSAVPFYCETREVRHDIFQHLHHFKQLPQAICISSLTDITGAVWWTDQTTFIRREKWWWMIPKLCCLHCIHRRRFVFYKCKPEYNGRNPLSYLDHDLNLCQVLALSDNLWMRLNRGNNCLITVHLWTPTLHPNAFWISE